jgi:hypothetical protein
VGVAAKLLSYPVVAGTKLLSALLGGIANARGMFQYLYSTYLPGLLRTAEGYALAEARAVEATLTRDVQALTTSIAHALQTAEAYAVREVQALGATVAGDVKALEASVAGAIKTAEAYAAREVAGIETKVAALTSGLAATIAADVSADLSSVFAKVTALSTEIANLSASLPGEITASVGQAVSALAGYVDVEASRAVAGVWDDIGTAVDGAIGVAGDADTDITDALKEFAKAVPTDLVGVLAGVGTLTLAMTRYLEDCGIPNCRNLSGLGRDLQALLGLVDDAAFIGLIVAMVTDPGAAAGDVTDALGGIASDTINAAQSLFGVS